MSYLRKTDFVPLVGVGVYLARFVALRNRKYKFKKGARESEITDIRSFLRVNRELNREIDEEMGFYPSVMKDAALLGAYNGFVYGLIRSLY